MAQMTRAEAEKELWRSTHRDFKGQIAGVKTVMVLRNGGSTLVSLAGLTEAELESRVKGYFGQ